MNAKPVSNGQHDPMVTARDAHPRMTATDARSDLHGPSDATAYAVLAEAVVGKGVTPAVIQKTLRENSVPNLVAVGVTP